MLYESKIKEDHVETMDELITQFEAIYKKHNIDILGAWANADEPSKIFYLSNYENEEDYKRKTEELRKDATYAELTTKLEEIRVSSSATRLTPKWLPD